MNFDASRIKELVERPSESLSVEIKRWINPDQPEGVAKIVKTAIALRNYGGGYMLIGFDNDTLQPDQENIPQDVRALFHLDKIQAMISRYSSESFEVAVEFEEREGQVYPVVIVPQGIKTPIATKSELRVEDKTLISSNTVYVRSLRSNNTPSTTMATWRDWSNILDVCFENREADIGRFLRRHLSGIAPEALRELISAISGGLEPEPKLEDLLQKCLQDGDERYLAVLRERNIKLHEHGTWEVALIISGNIPSHSANLAFLSLLDSSNPNYTGWPVWLNSRSFTDQSARPYVREGVWEAFILPGISGWGKQIDFMRINPLGRFYLRRGLDDDSSGSPNAPQPMTELDFGLPILRTAEAIGVGIAFAKAMGCDSETTRLAFAFKWTRLRGRSLTYWANPGRHISPGRTAHQDNVMSFVNVPLETSLSALPEFVNQVIQPLYEIFDGFQLNKEVVEDLTRRLIERRP